MMPTSLMPWATALMLALWLTAAGPMQAAEKSAPSQKAAAPRGAKVEETPVNQKGPTPPAQRPSAEQSPSRPPSKSRKMKTFRPSEEIHVDKAVDFPADI